MPREIREQVERFQYNLLAPLFACISICANRRATPQAPSDPELAQAFMVIMGLDHVDQFHDIVRHHEAGTIPPTVMWGACPTLFDPTQAPPGRHTAFMWEKLPYRLQRRPGELGSARATQHGRAMLTLWQQHAPNLEDAVHRRFTRSPLDVERCAAEHARGRSAGRRIHQRSDRLPSTVPRRRQLPHAYCQLYLCGSSSHPGGNITGLPGYNAAQVILRDLEVFRP